MTDARLRRVTKEIQDVEADQSTRITIEPVGANLFHLVGAFEGPEGTPYEGGRYEIDIVIPEGYPFQPPKMKFITKVYHPNISSASGAICLDILKDAWSPVLTLKSTLISLQSLLCDPQPNDPQDAEVAKHYLTSRASFDLTARHWAQAYAGAPVDASPAPAGLAVNGASARGPDPVALAGLEERHVANFENMGFERTKVIEVLKRLNYRGANVARVGDDRVVEELLK